MGVPPPPTESRPTSRREWQIWTRGTVLKTVQIARPLVASWEATTHPAQIRLRDYLDGLRSDLGELPARDGRLFLHMDVDVQEPTRLLRHYDLENYLTPVARHLGQHHFC